LRRQHGGDSSRRGKPAAPGGDIVASAMTDPLTGQTVELLQQLIRNQCVNDGTVGSGQEVRTSDVLRTYLQGSGLDAEVYEAPSAPGSTSLVARIEGSDPKAP